MADYTEQQSEVMYPLAYAHPDSYSPAATTSAYVSFANYHRGWLFIDVGDMVATATLDVSLMQATTTAGGGPAKAFTPAKAITQLTQAGGDGDDLICVQFQTEELDVDNGFDCVAVLVTVGTAAVELSWCLFGIVPRFPPVPTTNWTERVA